MNKIIEFGNIIKFDSTKCNLCRKCLHICELKAFSLYNDEIEFNIKRCIGCKKCINICEHNALFYNVNSGKLENNTICILPSNADIRLLNKKYNNIKTIELGEKVNVIETSFEMINETNKKINNENYKPLIISDINNIDLILSFKKPSLVQYLSKTKDAYFISAFLTRLEHKNVNISAYGIPFENKIKYYNSEIINEICDIPFVSFNKYNIMDILFTYMNLCKLETKDSLVNIDLSKNTVLNLYNKVTNIKIIFINNVSTLYDLNINEYDFIFVCKNQKYNLNNNLLKNKELNDLYKFKLKFPGNTTQLFRKE